MTIKDFLNFTEKLISECTIKYQLNSHATTLYDLKQLKDDVNITCVKINIDIDKTKDIYDVLEEKATFESNTPDISEFYSLKESYWHHVIVINIYT